MSLTTDENGRAIVTKVAPGKTAHAQGVEVGSVTPLPQPKLHVCCVELVNGGNRSY